MVKKIVSEFINHHKTDEKFEMCRPYIPFHIKFIANSQTSTKSIYLAISDKEVSHTNEIKWNESLTEIIDKENWKNLYKACFFAINDTVFIWSQYRILHRILGVNYYLYKTKISDTENCRLCQTSKEILGHLFSECPKVYNLWQNVYAWINQKLNLNLNFNATILTLGYPISDISFWPLNFILIITRY